MKERIDRKGEHIALADGSTLSYLHREGANAAGTTPVIFAPGVGESAKSFKGVAGALAERGHDVYAVTQPTTRLKKKFFEKQKAEAAAAWKEKYRGVLPEKTIDELFKNIPLTEFRKAEALVAFTREAARTSQTGKVNIIGHSEGGANGLIAAFLAPELFERVILVNPAGQSGTENFARLFGNFHFSLFKEAFKTGKWKQVGDTLRTLLGHAGLAYARATRDGWHLSKFNAFPFLDALGRVAPDMAKVTFFDSTDRIFRAEKIKRAVEIAKGSAPASGLSLGEWQETKGHGHYGPVTNPEMFAELFHKELTPFAGGVTAQAAE